MKRMLIAGLLVAVLAATGCGINTDDRFGPFQGRASLTQPVSAFIHFRTPDGRLIQPASAIAVEAPAFRPLLNRMHEDGLINLDEVDPWAYRITTGLRLNIVVEGEQTLAGDVNVRPDGKVALPLIGEVVAAGRTFDELHDEVYRLLSKYYTDPVILINADAGSFGDRTLAGDVSVISTAGNQGLVELFGEEHIMEVVSAQSVFNSRTEWREVAIYREVGGYAFIILVDFERYLQGEFEQNVKVLDGDVVFVPETRNTPLQEFLGYLTVVDRTLSQANSAINGAARLYTRDYPAEFDRDRDAGR